jgi:PKD repeat protein
MFHRFLNTSLMGCFFGEEDAIIAFDKFEKGEDRKMKAKTRIRRSIRAISPVISVLLMIAIAVAASLVAYAWMMGYIGGTTTKAGKAILIQSMAPAEDGNLLVYVQNVGQGSVTISSVYVDDVLRSFTPDPNFADNKLPEGKTASLKVDFVVPDSGQVKVKVITTEGTFTESTAISSGQGSSGGLNIIPTAAFSFSPTDPETGETVTFTDASTDSDGSVVAWAWTFGDGGTSTAQKPTHSYASANTYTVRLTVTDDDGATNYVEHVVSVGLPSSVLDHFDFDTISSPQTAGNAFGITIRAIDQYGDPFSGFTGTVSLTAKNGAQNPITINPGTSGTFTNPTNGVWTGPVTIPQPDTGVTITATDSGSGATGTSTPAFDVNVGQVTIQFRTSGIGTDTGSTNIVTIDATSYNYNELLTLSFQWTPSTTHTITALSPIGAVTGKQYVYSSWSDLGAQTHTYTVPSSPATVTANYQTQYQLTMATNFGTTTPAVGSTWYNAGATVTISATAPSVGGGEQYVWNGWTGTGSGSYTGTNNPANNAVTMNAPITETASWTHQYQLTVTASPSGAIGGTFSVTYTQGGTPHTNEPHTTTWPGWTDAGTSATVSSPQSPYNGYTFSSYNPSATVTMDSAKTVTLTYSLPPPVLDHFDFDTISSPQTAGSQFSITIRAKDQYNNPFTSYIGTNTLSVSTGTISPTSTTAFTAGVWTGSVTLYTTGTGITIGTTGATKTGTSNGITVNAGSGTFGNTNQGSNSQDIEDSITGGQFTCSQSGTAQSITAYITVSSTRNIKAAIYTSAGVLVGSTEEKSVSTSTDGWVTFNFLGTKPSLSAGTTYTLVVWSDSVSGSATLSYSSSGGTGRYYDRNYGSWPSSVSFNSDGSRNYSIYCTYSIP